MLDSQIPTVCMLNKKDSFSGGIFIFFVNTCKLLITNKLNSTKNKMIKHCPMSLDASHSTRYDVKIIYQWLLVKHKLCPFLVQMNKKMSPRAPPEGKPNKTSCYSMFCDFTIIIWKLKLAGSIHKKCIVKCNIIRRPDISILAEYIIIGSEFVLRRNCTQN